ncbi:MAG TPA: hypothetical protein ENJ82_17000 [Bacteroidetes bacterium]|nr:hypothetical protein [Bacteroidota bacterium]
MPKYSPGDVVSIAFPNQETPNLSTYRPAIVFESLQDEIEVVFITKQLHQQSRYPDSFIVTCDSSEGKAMGLTFDSLIVPSRRKVLPVYKVTPPKRGECPAEIFEKLEEMILGE